MQWLIPVGTAAWAIWTWAHDHALERERERAKMAALYVNPFLSACEDLQSRIYKILELSGLEVLRERYPDGAYAEETLYLIVRYFGWLAVVNRYGPYTQDPVVIRHATAVRRAFATTNSELTVGPFNFFLPEQRALGKIVMHSEETGEHGLEIDTISFYDFKQKLAQPPLSDSTSVQQSIAALRTAEDPRHMSGWERLAGAQNQLVDLLGYLEAQEGFNLFQGERKKCWRPKKRSTQVASRSPKSVATASVAAQSGQA